MVAKGPAGIVQEYGERLRSYIRRRVRDDEDSWDIMQDVFLALCSRWNLGDAVENLTAWLFSVARNKIADLYRRRRLVSLDGLDPDGEMASRIIPLLRDSRTPERDWAADDLRRRLATAIEALPEPLREAFVSSELRGESFEDMARRTGTPVNTLLSRKHRAVLGLRKSLADLL